MADRRALRGLRVLEQRTGRADGEVHSLDAEPRKIAGPKMFGEHPRGRCVVEMPVGETLRRDVDAVEPRHRRGVGKQDLRRTETREFRRERRRCGVHRAEVAGGEREPCDPDAALRRDDRHQDVVATVVQQRRIGERAGCHDTCDAAFHRALGRRRVADLFADRDRLAELHESREIRLDRVEGHARHPDRLARRGTALRERDVEQARGAFGVLEEEFVEVAHAVEQQLVRMLRLDPEVLGHHRGVLFQRAARAGGHRVLVCLQCSASRSSTRRNALS